MGYIYLVINKETGRKYVGQTKDEDINKRWKRNKNMCKTSLGRYLLSAYKKYGIENFEFKIICICFDEDCDRFEDEYITKFNTIAPNGYNLRGGGGNRGRHHADTLELMSKKLKGRNKGKVPILMTPEVREKISKALKGRILDAEQREKVSNGRKKATETRKENGTIYNIAQTSINNLQKGHEQFRRKVGQYNLDGELIAIYESLTLAVKEVNGSHSSISNCCKGVKGYKTHKGFIWKFLDDKVSQKRKSRIYTEEEKEKRKRNYIGKAIVQYDLNDVIIKQYESIAEAIKAVSSNRTSIRDALNGKQNTAAGYKWKYV
jgi:group I intron endonuclease